MIFLTGQWEWELQRGPQIPPPLNFFDYWRGGGAILTFLLNDQHRGGEGVSVKKLPCRYITHNNDKKDKNYKKHAVPLYKTITFSTH